MDARQVMAALLLAGILAAAVFVILRILQAALSSQSMLETVVQNARLLFGFSLLACLFILALVLAVGHIEEGSSFGLTGILESLKALTSFWAGWAFAKGLEDKK